MNFPFRWMKNMEMNFCLKTTKITIKNIVPSSVSVVCKKRKVVYTKKWRKSRKMCFNCYFQQSSRRENGKCQIVDKFDNVIPNNAKKTKSASSSKRIYDENFSSFKEKVRSLSLQHLLSTATHTRKKHTKRKCFWFDIIFLEIHKMSAENIDTNSLQILLLNTFSVFPSIRKSGDNSGSRQIRNTPDWSENAMSGDHLWVPTSVSGDCCYVGDNDCTVSSIENSISIFNLNSTRNQ